MDVEVREGHLAEIPQTFQGVHTSVGHRLENDGGDFPKSVKGKPNQSQDELSISFGEDELLQRPDHE